MKTAFPTLQQTVKITLYSNIPFDNTYKHHTIISRLFKDDGDTIYNASDDTYGLPKERFINRRDSGGVNYYYPRYTFTGDYNFDYSNGLVTSVTMDLTPAQTNANYMKVVCGNDIYYYFITGISQLNYETYKLSLELDVLMTYQDELLTGLRYIPVFTERKHDKRFTQDGLMPKCCDFKTSEDMFSNVKPSIIEKKQQLYFNNLQLRIIKDVVWLYICAESPGDYGTLAYRNKSVTYPLSMLCLPLNVNKFTIKEDANTTIVEFTREQIDTCISKYLVGNGTMYGAKVSNYPPFTNISYANINASGELTIYLENDGSIASIPNLRRLVADDGNVFACATSGSGLSGDFFNALVNGCLCIMEQESCDYDFYPINVISANASAPTVIKGRYTDPKLLFNPFKKYVLNAKYSSEGNEFYPELLYSCAEIGVSDTPFKFSSITTAYIGDTNIFTYLDTYSKVEDGTTYYFFQYYKYQKIGLACTMNYMMPVGKDALAVFNATQSQSFYTSKVASGVSSGLAVIGGIAQVAIGAGMVATTGAHAGSLTPAGAMLVAGGSTAIASGVSGVATTIKSSFSKIEDLKNTPDAINISGSNFISDSYVVPDNQPFFVVYGLSPVVKRQIDDYFYQYGYQVARDCYFNLELTAEYDAMNWVDTLLFNRRIFNYVKLREDITNKIDYDMPLIVKKKISDIFNNGITLWSFFGNNLIWGTQLTPVSTNSLDKWFMKNLYDNTEY